MLGLLEEYAFKMREGQVTDELTLNVQPELIRSKLKVIDVMKALASLYTQVQEKGLLSKLTVERGHRKRANHRSEATHDSMTLVMVHETRGASTP